MRPTSRDARGTSARGASSTRRSVLPRLGKLARSKAAPKDFADVYDEMAETVFAWFLRETRDYQDAMELTSEAFEAAFAHRDDFRGSTDAQGRAWIWSIVRSTLGDYGRDKQVKGRERQLVGWARTSVDADDIQEYEQLVVAEIEREHLTAAMQVLPADQEQVLLLRFGDDDLSYIEIAERLGISYDVARSRKSRGLQTLRGSHRMRKLRELRRT
jgi:RNA polymerase sigma factor (sigma-70 family)